MLPLLNFVPITLCQLIHSNFQRSNVWVQSSFVPTSQDLHYSLWICHGKVFILPIPVCHPGELKDWRMYSSQNWICGQRVIQAQVDGDSYSPCTTGKRKSRSRSAEKLEQRQVTFLDLRTHRPHEVGLWPSETAQCGVFNYHTGPVFCDISLWNPDPLLLPGTWVWLESGVKTEIVFLENLRPCPVEFFSFIS